MSSIELIPQASSSAAPVSLYQQSVSLIERLYSISGFEPYLFPDGLSGFFDGTITPDPVSILWNCFRLGAPLCHLLNQSEPSSMLVVPDVSGFSGVYSNLQKKPIYHFIVACKQELLIPDEDIFSISEMYKDDMNGFVKIMKTVSLVTEIVYSRSSITTRPLPFNMGSSSASDEKPTDTRSKVIAELLDTERKYVVHLGELQVCEQF
jgi:cell division control protein 24